MCADESKLTQGGDLLDFAAHQVAETSGYLGAQRVTSQVNVARVPLREGLFEVGDYLSQIVGHIERSIEGTLVDGPHNEGFMIPVNIEHVGRVFVAQNQIPNIVGPALVGQIEAQPTVDHKYCIQVRIEARLFGQPFHGRVSIYARPQFVFGQTCTLEAHQGSCDLWIGHSPMVASSSSAAQSLQFCRVSV